jgi:hypothetical protein
MVSVPSGVLAHESDHIMEVQRSAYRARQFFLALWARLKPERLELARQLLTPAQFELFQRLQPSEMVHALSVCQHLRDQGYHNHDLLVAALLHDIGKARYPLHLWERVVVVLGSRFFPHQAAHWGDGPPQGWRRPFVIAARHPAWGEEMAAEVGASPLSLALIRHHQDTAPGELGLGERGLLSALQAVDNNQ